ncbi:hypothetical protein BCR32DRAFT_289709 [Anaeromyces robustus]|uniref:FANCI solenoid 4 domain-containing protein n=1 Tax=Anaeromyces robustus TaxID=1754192 RepID=A0A1Y1XMF9_9FUNG|nr:hypothetical protein BCR32DRAFT_289709 [Anaeromyces robustus]|eukprot:ORX86912.1 hypothetical protein BCR32DRAFT_289709 [Anaeromyces robustus]
MVEMDVESVSESENSNELSTNLTYCNKSINDILELFNSAKINELTELFDSISEDNEEKQVKKYIKSLLKQNITQAVQFIMALFQASNSNISIRHLKRKKIALFCFVKWLEHSNSSVKPSTEKLISEAVNFLIAELDSFTDIILMKLCDHILEAIKKKKDICSQLFDIIPPTLQILSSEKINKNETSNASYKNEFIDTLLNLEWEQNISIPIISILKDISLNKSQIELVSENIINRFDTLDISELPSAIYQLLLITKKGNKNAIITGIVDYFCKLEKNEPNTVEKNKNIKQIEGTVILQICLGMNLDHNLGIQFIKYMKETKTSNLTKFNISLLLSMAKIHRYEDTILDYLKSIILKCFKDNMRLKNSLWLNEYYPFKIIDISDLMLSIVKDSTIGNEQIIQSMVKLGFILVDSMSVSAPFAKQADKAPPKNEEKTPYDYTCELGHQILYKLFKLHDIVRMSILDAIMSRIVSKSSSIFKILELLEKIIRKCSNSIIPYHNKILECIDYISPLSDSMAEMLFKAITPIINNNMNFKNTVLLNLRKRLYNKEYNSRQNALIGFIVLLKSQCEIIKNLESEDIQSAKNSKILIYEILGNIRRCFKQQPEIRLKLYEYLLVMIDEYEDIVPSIFEIVFSQFKGYLDESDGNVVLKLSSCIEGNDEPYIIEPLPYLLSVLTKSISVMVRTENLNVFSKLFDKSRDLMRQLIESICDLDFDAFGINTISDFTENYIGNSNYLYCLLLLGCQEALMEYIYRIGGYSVESAQSIMSIFRRHSELMKITKDKRKKLIGNNIDSSIFSLVFLSDIIDFIFSNDSSKYQNTMNVYKNNTDFIQFIINVTNNRLNNQLNDVQSNSVSDIQQYSIIGRSLLFTFFENQDFSKPIIDLTNKINKSQFSYVLDCIIVIIKLIIKNYPDKLNDFMISITEKENETNIIFNVAQQLKNLVDLLISNEVAMNSQAVNIIDCIGKFSNLLVFNKNQKSLFKEWLHNISINNNIEDSSLAKTIVVHLFKFSDNDYDQELYYKIAKISLYIIGTILEDDEESSLKFDMKIINKRTYSSIVMTLYYNLNEVLDEIEWSIEQIRTFLNRKKPEKKDAIKNQIKKFEQQLYKKMKYIVLTLNVIEQAQLKGTIAENCIKLLSKTYKVLSSFLRWKLKDYKLIDPEYTELMNNVSSSLTQDLYEFIFYLQKIDIEIAAMNEANKKNKKGTSTNIKQKSKIMRESKTIPNLIYMVEIYERYLIQLTKKTGVNFLSLVKRSISRDFRIQVDEIDNEENNVEEEEEEEDIAKKKFKTEHHEDSE